MEEIMKQNLRVVSFIILSLMLLPLNASAQLVKGAKSSTNSGSSGTKTTNTGGIRGLRHLRASEDQSYRNSHRRHHKRHESVRVRETHRPSTSHLSSTRHSFKETRGTPR